MLFRSLYCWGAVDFSQLYNPGLNGATHEPQRFDGTNWQEVSAGEGYTCGIKKGELYCWGYNGSGQLGNGKAWELTPVPVVEP